VLGYKKVLRFTFRVFQSRRNTHQERNLRCFYEQSAALMAVGTCEGDCYQGKGVFTNADGRKYDGDWSDGKPHGRGVGIDGSFTLYEGQWQRGKWHGKGASTWSDGTTYDGEWRDGQKHGQGVLTQPGGVNYKGEWKENKRHGNGVFADADQSLFSGQWKEDQKDGEGLFTFADGARYDGQFRDGAQHGKGLFTYLDGGSYSGQWQKGQHHGDGVFAYADGHSWAGQWKKDMQHGKGVHTFDDATTCRGEWEDGKRQGNGPVADCRGSRSEHHGRGVQVVVSAKNGGEFRDGKGAATQADGIAYRKDNGDSKDGKHHGNSGGCMFSGDWKAASGQAGGGKAKTKPTAPLLVNASTNTPHQLLRSTLGWWFIAAIALVLWFRRKRTPGGGAGESEDRQPRRRRHNRRRRNNAASARQQPQVPLPLPAQQEAHLTTRRGEPEETEPCWWEALSDFHSVLHNEASPTYKCSITHEVMRDPWMLVETTNNFEATAIYRWVVVHGKTHDPKTREELTSPELKPNVALRRDIRSWCECRAAELANRNEAVREALQPVPVEHSAVKQLHVFVDDSNLVLGAQGRELSVGKLVARIHGTRQLQQRVVVGSGHKPAHWARWKEAKYEVYADTARRGPEVFVDEALMSQIAKAASQRFRRPRVLAVVTGDGNANGGRATFPDHIQTALLHGWSVELYAWKGAVHRTYALFAKEYPERFQLVYLDGAV
jgi:hypothetical protein